MAAGGGGAWKVAYADFVTAMMALFMVLWILGQDEEVSGSVEEFFKNPWKAALSDSTGIIPVENADVVSSRKANFENPSMVELEAVKRVNEDLIRTFIQNNEFREHRSLDVQMTPDGVLINFLDNPSEPVFEKDSPDFTEYGAWIFNTIAWEIARYPTTQIELEGHTEEGFQKIRKDYGSWEISVDRANSARRRLLSHGVKPSQIIKVAGFGGSKPLKDRNSVDPSNRRVTVMLRAGKDPN